MLEHLDTYILVYFTCTTKFLPGMLIAFAGELNFLEAFISSSLGGISGVIFYIYFGKQIAKAFGKYFKRKKPRSFSSKRRLLTFWLKYGLIGVALITPPIISPPVGVAIALSFREKPKKIITYMAISVLLWAALLAFLGEQGIALVKGWF